MKHYILVLMLLVSGIYLYCYENEQALVTWMNDFHTMEFMRDPSIFPTGLVHCDPLAPGQESYWSITGHLKVGDARDLNLVTGEFLDFKYRMYLTFNLSPILALPAEAELLAIRIRLYLIGHWGERTGYGTVEFPYWDGFEQTEHECTLSHITLGDSLGVEDWDAGEPGHPGTLESNLGIVVSASLATPGYDPYEYEDYNGYYRMDVTEAVFRDLEEGRTISQFRVAFMGMETDGDAWFDYLNFHPGYPCIKRPYMEVDYLLPGGARHCLRAEVEQTQLSIVPNPVRDLLRIDYVLPGMRSDQVYGIYNIRGQKLSGGEASGERGSLQLDLSNYPSGSYLIRIGDKVGRFIKSGK